MGAIAEAWRRIISKNYEKDSAWHNINRNHIHKNKDGIYIVGANFGKIDQLTIRRIILGIVYSLGVESNDCYLVSATIAWHKMVDGCIEGRSSKNILDHHANHVVNYINLKDGTVAAVDYMIKHNLSRPPKDLKVLVMVAESKEQLLVQLAQMYHGSWEFMTEARVNNIYQAEQDLARRKQAEIGP